MRTRTPDNLALRDHRRGSPSPGTPEESWGERRDEPPCCARDSSRSNPHRARWRVRDAGGFTLVELILGMLVTALVMGALAALLGSVAQGWAQSGAAQATSNVIVQTHVRIQRIIKGVRRIGACRTGAIDGTAELQAAVLLWKSDENNDCKIQLSEMALLECGMAALPVNCAMRYRTLAYPAAWTVSERAAADGTPVTSAEFENELSIDNFRAILDESAYAQSIVVARNIVGAEFRRGDGATVTRPTFHYLLNIQRGAGRMETEYGSATVRTPTTYPSS